MTALELGKDWSECQLFLSNYQSTYSAHNTRNSQLEGIGNKNGQATRNTYLVVNRSLRLYLNYNFKAGKNKFDLMAGYSWEEKKNNGWFRTERRRLL